MPRSPSDPSISRTALRTSAAFAPVTSHSASSATGLSATKRIASTRLRRVGKVIHFALRRGSERDVFERLALLAHDLARFDEFEHGQEGHDDLHPPATLDQFRKKRDRKSEEH